MRRGTEHIFLLIERTVPMLLAIGAVLSVLLLFFRDALWLSAACIAVWTLALAAAVSDFVFSVFFKEKGKSKGETTPVADPRDRGLSEVAHELKTPLTVIRGSVEALADGAVPAEMTSEFYARILRETDGMTKLINDLLEATREGDKFRFDPQKTDLSDLVTAVCGDLSPVAEKKGVLLTCNVQKRPLTATVDPDRFGQLTVIFLDNAIKHTAPGGRVTLTVEQKGKRILLRIADTGSGIAPEDLPHIFDRFYKAPPERGGLATGSGIGLAVAKKIADLHHAVIDVESKPGKGTRFTVSFPLPQ